MIFDVSDRRAFGEPHQNLVIDFATAATGVDEREVGECLREVPQVLAGGHVDDLGRPALLVELADPGAQRLVQPDRVARTIVRAIERGSSESVVPWFPYRPATVLFGVAPGLVSRLGERIVGRSRRGRGRDRPGRDWFSRARLVGRRLGATQVGLDHARVRSLDGDEALVWSYAIAYHLEDPELGRDDLVIAVQLGRLGGRRRQIGGSRMDRVVIAQSSQQARAMTGCLPKITRMPSIT